MIDGRGEDKLIVNGTVASYSWWDQAGTAQLQSGSQNNPILMMASGANLVLYKITVRNSAMFHIKWSGNLTTKTGFTAWGVKVITPFTARNSDGIDPSGLNISVLNSSISDGDDNVAVSASSAAQNITVQNVNTYSGHGISVGSITKGGLTNMLVQNITQMGTAADKNAIGIRIKAQQSNGGLVQNVTYQNICSANNRVGIYLGPYYSTSAGTSYPSFQNILYRNIHIITEPLVTIQGYMNTAGTVVNPSTVTLDNVVIDTLQQKDFTPAPQNLAITLGPGPVSPLLTTLTGTNISYTGSVTNPSAAPYPCDATKFQYLVGEMYGAAGGATNLKTMSLNAPVNVTLNAMVEPAMSQVSYTSISGQGTSVGSAAPTAAVQFLEGTTVVGTGALGSNGTLASLTLNGVRPGAHTYSAVYPGDANYTVPLTLGTVSVTVIGVPSTTTLASTGTLVYGDTTTLTATVTGSGGAPTGSVQFMDGGVNLGAAQTLSGGTASLTVNLAAGSHMFTAAYLGDSTFTTSSAGTSVAATVIAKAQAVSAVTAASVAINPAGTTAVTVTVPVIGGGVVPTGTVSLTDAGMSVGAGPLVGGKATVTVTLATMGAHTITAVYSGDGNYLGGSGTLTVSVVTPFALSVNPAMVSVGPNGVATPAVLVTPAGGFSGPVTVTCASPVLYVTCVIIPSTVAVGGGVASQAQAIITVPGYVSAVGASERTVWLAMLLPVGLAGLAGRRRGWGKALLLVMLMAGMGLGLSGCGSGTGAKRPPTGVQMLTVTATGSANNIAYTSTAQIMVTVTN